MKKIDRNIMKELKCLVHEIMPKEKTTINILKGKDVNDFEVIDNLRVGVKYLLLNIEALQRENKILKDMWDNE